MAGGGVAGTPLALPLESATEYLQDRFDAK